MKVVAINTVDYGSTGKIMLQIAEAARNSNHEMWTFSNSPRFVSQKKDNHYYFGSYLNYCVHYVFGKYTGGNGLFSVFATLRLLVFLKKFNPDVVHLHNLHGFFINLPMLFSWIKKNNVKVVWTLHDCWSFTGHCPHFTMVKCGKWKTGCHHCPQKSAYPESFLDNSRLMYRLKKKWFVEIENMTIVTPSQWLADLVKQSFLKDYPVQVIHNGIDLNVFKPTSNNFRQKYNISESKAILLGVAFGWGVRKGLDVFVELSNRLDEDEYQIVLVGTDDNVDKQLPSNIISIHRTHNQKELAEIYTVADLFVNPTREENYPTVNMESIACGTPVLTFRTGGSPEIVDQTSGAVVECDNIDAMEREIIRICTQKPYSVEACLNRAKQFDMNDRFEEYVRLYEPLK